ncbi:hypothetical protein [uncultured Limosilactobacillus sp.]|uniref:DUF1659 domain-containing protein n=1 Tax=uncultured Limosilactobacillus sp. TaxID=2837629 RepID=UPI0025D26FEA|nr:hypothetical protein [uncultured Limosilactobacillus sp.]
MNNSAFKSAKLRLEMSGVGDKNKTIVTFNNLVQSPSADSLHILQTAIETFTAGTIEDTQLVVTSQLN